MAQKFLTNVELEAGLVDGSNSTGTSGYLLSSTGTATSWVDPAAVSVGESEQVHIACKNTSGVAISKGDPVYITGTVGTSFRIQIAAADASNSAKMPAVGLAETDLANNAEGYVIASGVLKNLTTDPLSTSDGTPSSNDTVYVKAGGGLTKTKPTGSGNLIQNVGKVGRVNSANAGSLAVSTIMRTNDVPNLTTGKIWVGSSTYTTESGVVHLDEGNGRMGIGTTSPAAKLDVSGGDIRLSTNATYLRSKDSASAIPRVLGMNASNTFYLGPIDSYAGGGIIYGASGNVAYHGFYGGGSEKVRITSSGNVGIGTTSPSYKLDAAGTSRIQGTIHMYGAVRNYSGDFSLQNGVQDADILFKVNDGGTTKTAMMIDGANLRVGINTTSPQVSLEAKYSGTEDEIVRIVGTASGKPQMTFYNDTTLHTKIVAAGNNDFSITNTHSTGDIFFAAGGATRLHIDSNGKVGIGTTAPSAKLDSISPDGNTNSLRLGRSDNSNYWDFNHAGNDLRIFNTAGSGSDVLIGPNSGGTDQGNRLAIGTATPTQRLHVNGNARVTGAYYDSNNSAGTSGQVLSSTGTGTDWIDAASGGGVDGSGTTNYVAKWSDSDTITNSILFDTGTNVGIGTTSPALKLEVEGADGLLQLSTTSSTGNPYMSFNQAGARRSFIQHVDSGDNLKLASEYGGMQFFTGTGGTETVKMTIQSGGNVGIGTTSPASNRKLHVAGNARVDSTFYLGTDESCAFFRYYNALIITNSASTNITLGGGPGSVNNNVYVGNGFLDVSGYIRGKNYFYLEDAAGTLRTTLRSESTYATLDNGTNTLNTIANAHIFLRSTTEIMRVHTNNNVGIGTSSPGEKLEVNGTVKATATTDAYKGYIKQTVVSNPAEKVESTDYNFFPYNTTSTSTGAQAYNRMTAAYDGRIKKVYLRHSGGNTPTATAVKFKKHTNGVTSSTVYSATVTNTASTNMTAYYEFGNTDFTFSAGDLIGLLYQTSDAFGTASKTMGAVAATIIIEYNIT